MRSWFTCCSQNHALTSPGLMDGATGEAESPIFESASGRLAALLRRAAAPLFPLSIRRSVGFVYLQCGQILPNWWFASVFVAIERNSRRKLAHLNDGEDGSVQRGRRRGLGRENQSPHGRR